MFNFVLLKGRPFQNFTLKKKMDGLVIVRSLHVPIGPKWSQQYQILQNIPKQTFTFQVFQVNHKTENGLGTYMNLCGMIFSVLF